MMQISVPHLFDRKDFSERIALITGAQQDTYGDTAAAIDRVARGLWALGVRKGDRVCITMGDGPRLVHALFASWRIGAFTAVITTHDAWPRLIDWCNFITGSCLIVDEARAAGAAAHLDSLATCKLVISSDASAVPGVLPWAALLDHEARDPGVTVSGGDPLFMLRTSGTTAQPKGIWHTLDSLNARLRSHIPCPQFSQDDVACTMSPLYTVAGLNATVLPALAAGARVVLFATGDPERILEQICATGGTIIMGGPPRLRALIQAARARPDLGCPRLRFALSGGDTVPETLRAAWTETFGAPLLEGYGLSETLGGVLINKLGAGDHAGNVGSELPDAEVRLVGADGRDVPGGSPGEIWCKAPYLCGGYLNEPERTRAAIVDGWLRTGDLAARQPDGAYRILGRTDFLILRGTVNVAPVEIEAVLERHPAVDDCMVAGFPSERLGQDIEAFVVLREQIEASRLEAHVLERLGGALCPSRFWSVPRIPRTNQGKVDRRAADSLRAQATRLGDEPAPGGG